MFYVHTLVIGQCYVNRANDQRISTAADENLLDARLLQGNTFIIVRVLVPYRTSNCSNYLDRVRRKKYCNVATLPEEYILFLTYLSQYVNLSYFDSLQKANGLH